MRTVPSLVLAFVLAFLYATPDAQARRGGARSGTGLYVIAVAPFDGERAGGRTISEALELELELIETVLVQGDRWLRSDLRRAGAAGYEAAALRRIMSKRKVDILIRGRRAGRGVEVSVFGADGQPRFVETFPLPDDPDRSARQMVEAMRPVLVGWAQAPVVQPRSEAPASGRRAPVAEPQEPRVDEADLFVDFDDESRRGVRDSALPEPTPTQADAPTRRLDGDGVDDTPRRPLSDDGAGGPRRPLGAEGEAERPRRTLSMADVDDDTERASPLHWLALSVGGVGGGWFYQFTAAQNPQDDFQHQLWDYGGMARLSFWPLEYVGFDASASARTFSVNATGLSVVPSQLRVVGLSAGASARARFPFQLGALTFAPGLRAGYRYWSSSVDTQTHAEDGKGYTLIPGWQTHALSVGADLSGSLVFDRWRFEAELHLEPLPLVRYEETPDNPAVYAAPFGGNGTLILRIPVFAPVFLELHGSTTLAFVNWEGGPGTRLSHKRRDDQNNRVRIDGGETLNVQFGGGLSIGASF